MSTENLFAVLQGEQGDEVPQPIAEGDQGSAWLAGVTGDQTTPQPPPPMPEAAVPAPATPLPPPAMPEAAAPAAPTTTPPPAMPAAPATTMTAPAAKPTGGWEVDSYRLRAVGDAVVRARSYLDAVRMKVDRMQGPELSPQLGTSPVGQQLAKKFDDRLNAEDGLRAMLTEAMKRMERFVSTAEEASRAYEQAEENAVEELDKFKYEVEWWDDEPVDRGHGHHHDHHHGDDQARDDAEDQDDGTGDTAEDEPGDTAEDRPEEQPGDKPDDQAQDEGGDTGGDQPGQEPQDGAEDRGPEARPGDDPGDRPEDQPGDRSQDGREDSEQPGEQQDDRPVRTGRGAPG